MSRDTFDMFDKPERGRFGDNERASSRPRVMGASDLVDLDLVLHHETSPGENNKGAVLVSIDGNEARSQWLPKSRVEIIRGRLMVAGRRRSGQSVQLPAIVVTVPETLAKEKGLI